MGCSGQARGWQLPPSGLPFALEGGGHFCLLAPQENRGGGWEREGLDEKDESQKDHQNVGRPWTVEGREEA